MAIGLEDALPFDPRELSPSSLAWAISKIRAGWTADIER
jgi:hypothetical protein